MRIEINKATSGGFIIRIVKYPENETYLVKTLTQVLNRVEKTYKQTKKKESN